jgi:hypothetical protein
MPGLDNEAYYVALHFTNPNYAAHVVSALALVCFIQFDKASTRLWNAFYLIIYLIYATHLFINGSFAGITFFIMLQIIIQIIVGIKSKKIHFKMLVLSLMLLPICLLVDLLPNIQIMRTCAYNYLVECVAVFDNIFNTNLLSKFGIDWVAGADGWNRSELVELSWKERLSSPKSFIFGGGAGLFYQYRPHNGILSLMLDFGVVLPVLFILFVGCLIIKTIKSKTQLSKIVYLPTIICFLMCYMTGSIVPNSFYIFMIILALLFSDIFTQQDCN